MGVSIPRGHDFFQNHDPAVYCVHSHSMENKHGYLVISLDLELMWGMFDKVTIDSYGKNLAMVHEVVPTLLELFSERGIHATWASVGMLMAENERVLRTHLPHTLPAYTKPELSSYTHIAEKDSLPEQYYFAPYAIKKIARTPGQEIASHTFSHFYTKEAQQNFAAAFAADCKAMGDLASQYNVSLSSIVFPRNQWTEEALEILKKYDIQNFRGTEDHFLYRSRKESAQTNPLIRALRLLDHYFNLSGNHTYPLSAVPQADGSNNIPASRFLRPYSKKLAPLESLRMRRIKNAMTEAAKNGEVFHLWWHPHNFGAHTVENLKNLTILLDHFASLQERYGMESMNMREIAELASTPE